MEVYLEPIVVTATKGTKALIDVPVPTTLIPKATIAAQGAIRLADLLAEQPGLQLVYDHGKGIQIQGLASDYTLILIDGEPIIGRVAGTLDLERLTVGGIERIEVVRGPSSSLYGSEALAGVINIITARPENRWQTSIRSRYETHQTSDLNLEAETRTKRLGAHVYINRFATGGYDFTPTNIGQTVPQFTDYTVGGRFDWEVAERTEFNLAARLGTQMQRNEVGLLTGTVPIAHDNHARRTDWNLAPTLVHKFSPSLKLTSKLYASRFETDTKTWTQDTSTLQSRTQFDQRFGKAEVQLNAILGTTQLLTAGAGVIGEDVAADRIAGGTRAAQSGFVFAQHEWVPTTWLDLTLSARFDAHSDYGTNLSPKVALLLKPNDRLRVRSSVGTGFKAPTFQQLYLDFSNATSGYSVFGSVDAANALQQLNAEGQVAAFLRDLDALDEIQPERSLAFNAGIEWIASTRLRPQVNVFRNNVRDLIEAAPVAIKTNGQSAFTYFNLNRIVTQGFDVQLNGSTGTAWQYGVSYQFLDTYDRDVIDQLNAGSLFGRRDGRDFRLRRSDYGGLMNRSRHSGTLRLQYHHTSLGSTVALRGIYRGQYGLGDRNGNLILDADNEYVDGYWLWNVTVTQHLRKAFTLQAGAQNLFDHTDPTMIPSLAGRLLFASVQVDLD